MQTSAHNAYLETQVLTAAPHKLQLMLIEAAIRSGQHVLSAWSKQQENEDACEALIKMQEIVGELLAAVSSSENEVSKRLSGIYLYVFRTLTEAQLEQDVEKLQTVLDILEIEQETWRQVCEKFGTQKTSGPQEGESHPFDSAAETTPHSTRPATPILPQSTPADTASGNLAEGGFSFEA